MIGISGGVIGIVGGLAILMFNRQLVRLLRPRVERMPNRGPVMKSTLYRPTADGRVPVLYIVGVGWVVVGCLLLFSELTG